MSQVLVSILIPAYNAARWLAQTLDSAVAQNCPSKEIIVVENGSSDNTAEIARAYGDRGVKLICLPAATAAHARNRAFAESHGEFIQYLDADDLLSSGKIAAQIAQLDPDEPTLSLSALAEFFDGDDPIKAPVQTGWPFTPSNDPRAWLTDLLGGGGQGGFVALHQWLTPRKLIERAGPWNETLTVNDDGEFFSRVLLGAREIRTTMSEVAYYRRHRGGTNLSSSYRQSSAHLESMLRALDIISALMLVGPTNPRLTTALSRHFYECAYFSHPVHPDASRRAEARALELNPAAKPPIPTSPKAAIVRSLFGWRTERRLAYCLQKLRQRL